jgi:hypothetical protein
MPGMSAYALERVLQNELSNLVPLRRTNQQVYQLGKVHQPGLDGYGPMWETVSFVLPAFGTRQARISVQRDFHLIGLVGSATGANGYRLQMFDVKKRRRFSDRGFGHFNLLGGQGSVLFLRRPYRFDEPNSQLLIMAQNLDTVQSTVQLVLYGLVLRYFDSRPWRQGRPGHPFLQRFLNPNLGRPWFNRSLKEI